jgi:fructose-1,6-bisphosphatase II
MKKIVTGEEGAGVIDITAPISENIRRVAKAKGIYVEDMTIVVLDRPRHQELANEIREVGARIKFISDGDIAGAILAARPNTGADMLIGIGGSPEGVIAACAMKCLGGAIQAQLHPTSPQEIEAAQAAGIDLSAILTTNDLVKGEDVFVAATGITDGELLKGIRYYKNHATSHSLVMRGRSRTIRIIESEHPLTH